MGSPSIKLRMMENFGRKMSSIGCKWSSFNAPGTETLVSRPFSGESLFLIYRSRSQKTTIERGCAKQCNNLPTEKYSQAEAKSEIAKPPDLWSTLLSLFHEKVCLKSSFYHKIYSVGSQIIRPSGTRIRVITITVCQWLRLCCVYIIHYKRLKICKMLKTMAIDCDCDLRFFWEEAKRWTLHFTVKSVPMFSLMSDAPRQFSVFFVDVEVSHIKNERLTLPRRDRTSHSTNRPRPAYVLHE